MKPAPKKSIIYAYRLTIDNGDAPCIYDLNYNSTGLLTLVCCKGGQIRYKDTAKECPIKTGLRHTIGKRHKEEIVGGDIDVYLMGIYKNTLLYFAKITEILSMREYFAPDSRYKNRFDYVYIYDKSSDNFQRSDKNPNFYHDATQQRRDQLGEYALLSTCFAYWGKESKKISTGLLGVLPKHQENKCYQGNTRDGEQIMQAVRTQWNFKDIIQNEPRNLSREQCCKGSCASENHPVPKGVRHVKRRVC